VTGSGDVLLDIADLTIEYSTPSGAVRVLDGVDLVLRRGRRLAIVGESGSGKSTLVKAVLGLLPENAVVLSGTIRLDGQNLRTASSAELRSLRGRVISYIAQDPLGSLDPLRTIGSQVEESLWAHRAVRGKRERRSRVLSALGSAGLERPERVAAEHAHRLSGGMRQRALIAGGLIAEPRLLVADEPTSALDVTVQKRILDHLDSLVDDAGLTVLLVTHDIGVVADHADDIVVLRAGRIVEHGQVAEVLATPARDYTKTLVQAATVRPAERETRPAIPAGTPPLLRVEALGKVYAGSSEVAVRGVGFELAAGRTLALVGESGSGKSTTGNIVLGTVAQTSGRVVLDGREIGQDSYRRSPELRRSVQGIFQDPANSLDPLHTVARILAAPLRSSGVSSRTEREARVAEALDLVGLESRLLGRSARELSGGQAQRVAIARALILRPVLVVCDEPVSSLDVVVQEGIVELLLALQRELDVAYLFISHDLSVVERLADEIAVMRRGEIIEHGSAAQVLGAPKEEYTRELLDAVAGASLRKSAPPDSGPHDSIPRSTS
jgi:peptide/nickel transport system ATP-binding protein